LQRSEDIIVKLEIICIFKCRRNIQKFMMGNKQTNNILLISSRSEIRNYMISLFGTIICDFLYISTLSSPSRGMINNPYCILGSGVGSSLRQNIRVLILVSSFCLACTFLTLFLLFSCQEHLRTVLNDLNKQNVRASASQATSQIKTLDCR